MAHSLTRVIDENGQFVENYDDGLRTSSLDPVVRSRDLLLKDHRCYPIFGLIRLDALHKLPPQGSYVHSDRVLLLQLGLLGRFCEIPEYPVYQHPAFGSVSLDFPGKNQGQRVSPDPALRYVAGHGVVGSDQGAQASSSRSGTWLRSFSSP